MVGMGQKDSYVGYVLARDLARFSRVDALRQ